MIFRVELVLPCHVTIGPESVVAHPDGHVRHVGDCPAGERPRALLDVLFGVVTDAHREQLENLSTVVLVDVVLVVILVVQPQDHRRVLRELNQ